MAKGSILAPARHEMTLRRGAMDSHEFQALFHWHVADLGMVEGNDRLDS
jgi:hypothetical protein